jgi:gliding motility-associated-like protein
MSRIIGFLFFVLINAGAANAQTITNGDGSALQLNYCYEDIAYPLQGQPGGGDFSGCGMYRQNGAWYFNPVVASQDVTVFPFQCSITYTIGTQSVTRNILVYKPVRIDPPLQDTATCSGAFTLEATMEYAGAYNFAWSPAAFLDNPDTSYTTGFITQSQTFVIVAEDVTSGCTGSDTIRVVRNPVPALVVQPDTVTLRARESVQLHASGAAYYYWQPSRWLSHDTVAAPVAHPQAPVTYMVIGRNEEGCVDTAYVSIHILEDIMIPNAFSPNGDGLNDVFKIENMGYQGLETFSVYNRWGQMVFEAGSGTDGWDGQYLGRPAEAGTYFYLIRLSMRDGSSRVFRGEVQLIR